MYSVPVEEYPTLAALFEPLDYQLAPQAVLANVVAGRVYADRAQQPRSALIQVQHRCYLSGDPENGAFNAALRRLFAEEIYPQALARGEEAFTLYFHEGWETAITEQVLGGLDPIPSERAYYELSQQGEARQAALPEDLQLVMVDRALTEDHSLRNLEDLLEEMQSERESVEAFLARSFGVCLRAPDLLVTWCLSEYNLGARCEVGIATHPDYRRRGLAAATGLAFLEQARARAVTRVGWHCFADNLGSRASAERLGGKLVHAYPSFLAFYERPLHLAVRGNILLGQGAYREAQEWFSRAEATGSAPAWSYFAAACTAARLEEAGQAMRLLEQAVERGFRRRESFEQNENLTNLRATPEWQALLNRLS